MVQLSSPPVEMIPVKKGPSPEKFNAPKTEDNGFRTAYKEQKEMHESRDAENSTRRVENVSQKKNKAEQGQSDKPAQKSVEASTVASESKSTRKSVESSKNKSGLKLVKSDRDKKSLKLTGPVSEETGKESGKETKTLAVHQEVLSVIAGAVLSAESPAEVQDVNSDASALSLALEDLNTVDDMEKPLSDIATQVRNSVSTTMPQDIPVKESDKESKSRIQQKNGKHAADLKITVDDRRTEKVESPILKRVESESSSNKLTLELVPSDDVTSAMPQGEQADTTGKTFSLMSAEEQKGAVLLDRQLQDKGTQELTKNIRFVLKDNKEGEIKLILKPEALGKVRINLNMNENHIVGKIIVENNSVRQAFLNNLTDLTKALEDSGFSSASLDVSVGGGQTQGGSQYREEAPVFFTANALDDMDGQIPVIYENGTNLNQINLVV